MMVIPCFIIHKTNGFHIFANLLILKQLYGTGRTNIRIDKS